MIGINRMELAKMGGMTPAVLTFRGRCEASPPYIRLPVWRFGYWTTMRRWARSTKTMKKITPTAIASRKTINTVDSAPVRPNSRVLARAVGRLATMPEKMISEIPLPTPRAVICSPNHIRNRVPPTRVITVVKRKNKPPPMTAGPALELMPSRPTAMPYACSAVMNTVP